jgi:hypothetical protein
MATDATGTPTAVLGIPKYDTSVDAPSGLGFNAAMDVLDTLITAANKSVIKKAGVTVGTRRGLNLIEGANVTLTVTDDSPGDKVDVTIAAATGVTDPVVGGDLSGTASNAQIVANAVGATELADNAVDTNAIQAAAVTQPKLARKYESGSFTFSAGAADQAISFTAGFTAAPIVTTWAQEAATGTDNGQVKSVTSAGFTLHNSSGGTQKIGWLAVGA